MTSHSGHVRLVATVSLSAHVRILPLHSGHAVSNNVHFVTVVNGEKEHFRRRYGATHKAIPVLDSYMLKMLLSVL